MKPEFKFAGQRALVAAPCVDNSGGAAKNAFMKWFYDHYYPDLPDKWRQIIEDGQKRVLDSGASEGVGREDRACGDV